MTRSAPAYTTHRLGAGEPHQHEAGVLGERAGQRGRAHPRPRRRRPRTRRPSAPARSRSGRSAPAPAAPVAGRGSASRSPCRPRCAARRPRVRRPGRRRPRTARPRAVHRCLPKPGCCSAQPVGQRQDRREVERSPARHAGGVRQHVLHRVGAAHAAGRVDQPRRGHRQRGSGEVDRDDVELLERRSASRRCSTSRRAIASGVVTRSCTSHPAASSKSLPGVRIVTATRWAGEWGAATRISSGSSVATRSSWSSRVAVTELGHAGAHRWSGTSAPSS